MFERMTKRAGPAALLLAVAAAVLWPLGAHAADDGGVEVFMDAEAWYLELPPCTSLLDCSPLPPLNAYPKNTLHVAVLGVQEMARTDVSFNFTLPLGAELTAGVLTLPIDPEPADGSLLPGRANMVACLVTANIEPVRGSLAAPPPADCGTSAPALWNEQKMEFTVNLGPFVSKWVGGRGTIALMPAAELPNPELWHVVFYDTEEESKTAPPIKVTLEYTTTGGAETPPLPPQAQSEVPGFTGGVGFGPFPQPSTPAPAPLPTQPVVQPLYPGGFAGPGFAYPLVWALPLVILAGFGALGRALTKELYRPGG
jgi:hypothetical protein